MRYKPGNNMYTEQEMCKRVRKLKWPLLRSKGFDILLTHSPAKGFNDLEDWPHRGFEVFHHLLKKYEPKYFLHGHVHLNYGGGAKREQQYPGTRTTVVNAYEKWVIEI